ncbi:MAG: T9SS type A sorting domain-containing protein [Bacteroidota bacterium]
MRTIFTILSVLVLSANSLFGWGGNTHKFINKNAVVHLPASMQQFIDQQSFLETHAVDADNRKGSDPTEGPKHFLDIDYYPDYKHLTHNLDSLILLYGTSTVVNGNGILPWATVWSLDSLTEQLKRGDWTKAYQTAADIGHYVGDAHQPLHVAENYDGQMTGNKGIHSRYESTMMNKVLSTLSIAKDSVYYIADPMNFIFDYLYVSNALVDSVLAADRIAAPPSGYNGSGTLPANYYTVLWAQTERFTKSELQDATIVLASMWYTAWVNAGLLAMPTNVQHLPSAAPETFTLDQNFPNPFNPSTTIRFSVPKAQHVRLSIYNLVGQAVAVLGDADYQPGEYRIQWNAERFPSGIYFYQLESDNVRLTRKLVYLK